MRLKRARVDQRHIQAPFRDLRCNVAEPLVAVPFHDGHRHLRARYAAKERYEVLAVDLAQHEPREADRLLQRDQWASILERACGPDPATARSREEVYEGGPAGSGRQVPAPRSTRCREVPTE
jgi:hypothetical protein